MKTIILTVVILFCATSFAKIDRPERPVPPFEQIQTPYTLVGLKKDCSIKVLDYGYEANNRGKKNFYIDITTDYLDSKIVHLRKSMDYNFRGIDEDSGLVFTVRKGAGEKAYAPLARGTLVVSKKREQVGLCSLLVVPREM